MLDTILIPLDGSELADRILKHVRRLLVRRDAVVTLLHVARPSGGDGDEEARLAKDHIEALRDGLVAQGAQAEVRFEVGDAAKKIVEVANELGPSLIAMSTHGRSGLERFVRGSVAERVLSRATHPLLLANPFALGEQGELRIRRVLVPLDGSTLSAEVLPVAAEIAQLYGAELIVFHSLEPRLATFPCIAVAASREEAEKVLRGQIEHVEGIPVRVLVASGLAAATILDAAEDERVDLIAMTTHGRSGLSDWAFGSTAEKVMRQSPCPLLVVRKAAVRGAARTPAASRAAVSRD